MSTEPFARSNTYWPQFGWALLPIPLGLSVIVLLITGIPATEATPIPLAALAAFFMTHGLLGLGGQP